MGDAFQRTPYQYLEFFMSDSSPLGQAPGATTLPSIQQFPLGQLLATPGALRTLQEFCVTPASLVLMRHALGDWGDLDAHDHEQNRLALEHGGRLFSAYTLSRAVGRRIETAKVWCITESDRQYSTLLLPSEY